jgi:hypothetical protein
VRRRARRAQRREEARAAEEAGARRRRRARAADEVVGEAGRVEGGGERPRRGQARVDVEERVERARDGVGARERLARRLARLERDKLAEQVAERADAGRERGRGALEDGPGLPAARAAARVSGGGGATSYDTKARPALTS